VKKFLLITTILTLSACSHHKVEVTKVGDKSLTCSQINNEIIDLKILRKDIEEKTGMSGRNVGMAIIFPIGIVLNEVNGNSAEERIELRRSKLVDLHDSKKCDDAPIKQAEEKMAAEAEEKSAAKK
jgi:hypothetical protein